MGIQNQSKALLISRISKDKLDSINCFIKYCQGHNIDFEIAGDGQQEKNLIKELINKYKLKSEQFIGEVDALTYLKEHFDKYLFVGGVDLVMLEAGSLGYPCFVCSEWKNKNYSFVTNDNISLFDNFTIKSHILL